MFNVRIIEHTDRLGYNTDRLVRLHIGDTALGQAVAKALMGRLNRLKVHQTSHLNTPCSVIQI